RAHGDRAGDGNGRRHQPLPVLAAEAAAACRRLRKPVARGDAWLCRGHRSWTIARRASQGANMTKPIPSTLAFSVLLSAALAGSVEAQQAIVSPSIATNAEGSISSVYLWGDSKPRRYQQVHSDVGGSAKTITRMAWRKDGSAATTTGT